MIVAQTVDEAVGLGGRIVALALLAGIVSLAVAAVYRWYLAESVPQGVTLFLGASAIAITLNTTASLGDSIVGSSDLLDISSGLFTIGSLLLGGIASEAGRHVGDALGDRFGTGLSLGGLDRDISAFVKGGGRVLRVELPETIADMDGYEPVKPELKEDLAGRVLTFPGRLTFAELHDTFVHRLERDFGVGKVDVEFAEDGAITYLAVGRGQAGVGHTLAPGRVALAIRADPAYRSSPGDQVRIWRTDGDPERVATGELRGVVADVATVSVPEEALSLLQAEAGYRLETVPEARNVDREFVAILRRANETAEEFTITGDGDLPGRTVADVEVSILAIEDAAGTLDAPPAADTTFEAGQRVLAVGRPDELRRFAAAAQGTS